MSYQPFKPPQEYKPYKTPKAPIQPQCAPVSLYSSSSTVAGTGPGGIPNLYEVDLEFIPDMGHVPDSFSYNYSVVEDGAISGSVGGGSSGSTGVIFSVPPGDYTIQVWMSDNASNFTAGPTRQYPFSAS